MGVTKELFDKQWHEGDKIMEKNILKVFLDDIPVREIMTIKPLKVFEDDGLSIVEQKFVHNNASHLVVIDNENRLTGIISHKYLYKTQSPRKMIGRDVSYAPQVIVDGDSFYEKEILDGFILKNVMNRNPFSLLADDTVSTAIVNFAKRKLAFIPIVDQKNRVIGALSDLDVINFIARLVMW